MWRAHSFYCLRIRQIPQGNDSFSRGATCTAALGGKGNAGETYLYAFPVSVLLLKGDEAPVHIVGLRLGYVVKRILEDGPCPLHLANLLLKFGKLDEEFLLQESRLSPGASEGGRCFLLGSLL